MPTALAEKWLSAFTQPRPAGPRGLDTIRSQIEFSSDQIGFFRRVHRTYGDVSSFRLGTFDAWLICDPELIDELLLKHHDDLMKDALTHELDELLGRGLLTSEGDFWKRQRKLASPALRRRQIESYADSMVRLTTEMVDRWEDGEVVDLHHDMMDLTLRIVVKTLFNLDVSGDVSEVEEPLEDAMHFFHIMAHTLWRFLPDFVPTPTKARFHAALRQLDKVILGLIQQRKESGEEGDDLLWSLINAVDDEGSSMTDAQLRDECITIFLAGHETTALALSYTWWLLTDHPSVMQRLYEEVDEVFGDEPATAADVRRLPVANAVIKESMRLYPPAWIIGRETLVPIELGEWTIPKGAQVLFPQSVVHRDPRWYEAPDQFDPDRWTDEFESNLPRFAYFPFGGGARICIGSHFAIMEAVLVLVTMIQKTRLENRSKETELKTQPSVTLRPITKIEMGVSKRR